MTLKERKIEELAKKFGVADGFGCKPEEKCSECLLSDNCNCLKFAKMAIDFGYEDKKETKKEVASVISSRLKSHMYYPCYAEPSALVCQQVVDKEDIETEIDLLIK